MKSTVVFAILVACLYSSYGVQIGTVSPKSSNSCGLSNGGPIVQKVTPTFKFVDGLFWDCESNTLHFVDRNGATASRYFTSSGETHTVPFNNLVGKQFSAIFPVKNNENKFILAADKGLYHVHIMDNNSYAVAEHIMDVFTDQKNVVSYANIDVFGKLFIGDRPAEFVGHPLPNSSKVVRVDVPTKNITLIDNTFTQSSGNAFSQDYRYLYIVDIIENVIYKYSYKYLTGKAYNRHVVFNISDHRKEMPGSISTVVLDIDGKLWIGSLNFNGIVRFNENSNKIEQIITIPATVTNSLTFGGEHLDVLFVGTTKEFPVQNPEQEPDAGAVFAISGTGTRGWPSSRIKA